MVENGMTFSEEHLDELTEALYEDANPDGLDGITYEQLRGQMEKHEGLLESLSIKCVDIFKIQNKFNDSSLDETASTAGCFRTST